MKIDKFEKNNIRYVCKDCSEQARKDWQEENKETIIEEGDFVKIAIYDDKIIEHMWFKISLVITDKEFLGILANIPVEVKNIKYKEERLIKFKEIENRIRR